MTTEAHRLSPALAAITLRKGGDGVAYAGLLLERALSDISQKQVPVLELGVVGQKKPNRIEQARFVLRLALAQLLDPRSYWVFNHTGIARAQNLIPPLIRRPYGVLLCGIEAWDPALSPTRKASLRNAATRIAISHYTARRVGEMHPDVGSITACPLALLPSTSTATTYDRSLLAQVSDVSVLVVGRMSSEERYKGHDELLECWSSVVKRIARAQLVIVGQGDDVTRLREKAGSLGLSENVLFLGFVADGTLEALRQRVAFFAMPSRGEGFGLVYLEAMRSGLACLGGAHDAAADVIVNGVTGTLVDPSDRDALATTIITLLRSPEKRAEYGSAGKRRFEDQFTFEHYCERLRPILLNTFS